MKRKLVYLILCLVLTSQTEFGQIFKVTFLVQHFYQHMERDRSLSVMGFLEMHYWGTDLPDNDQEQDQQLPFKTSAASVLQVFVTVEKSGYRLPPVIYHSGNYFLPEDHRLPEGYLHGLLRPPRINNFV